MNDNRLEGKGLPVHRDLATIEMFSLLVMILMTFASIAGLLVPERVYVHPELELAFVPNDVVNLLIGMPILILSVTMTRRGKLLGLLLWPGALFYVIFTYTVYSLVVRQIVGLIVYLVLVITSLIAILLLLQRIDRNRVQQLLQGAVPERSAGAILAVFGFLFIVRAIINLADLQALSSTELALNLTDLILSPFWVVGGLLLWRRKPLGYTSGLGLLFQASMLFVGLIMVFCLQPLLLGTPFAWVDALVVAAMGLICFVPFGLYIQGVRGV